MPIATRDIVPLTKARANLFELAYEVKLGAEKLSLRMAKATWP